MGNEQVSLEYGQELAMLCFKDRNFSKLGRFLGELNSKGGAPDRRNLLVLCGAISCFSSIARSLEESRFIKLTGEPLPSATALTYAINHDPDHFLLLASVMLNGMNKIFGVVPPSVFMGLSERMPGLAGQSSDGSKQVSETPLRVAIVSMPDRMTASSVDRNASGEITQTTQIESDMKGVSA